MRRRSGGGAHDRAAFVTGALGLEQRLRPAFGHCQDAVCALGGASLRVAYANEAFRALAGLPSAITLRGRTLAALGLGGPLARGGREALANRSWAAPGSLVHLPSGLPDRWDITAQPLQTPGAGRAALVFARRTAPAGSGGDQSRGVAAREPEQRRLLTGFLAILAHELRNPLAANLVSLAAADRALGAGPPDPGLARVRRHLRAAAGQAERTTGLLTDLLEAARIGLEPPAVSLGEFDLVRLCRQMLREVAAADAVHTYSMASPRALRIRGDHQRLAQVLTCLLRNARDYSPAPGPIALEVCEDRGWATVLVHDAGLGVPEADQGRIFDGFYRGSNVRGADAPSGWGIGLYVARALITAHGGHVGMRPAPGRGSTFFFSLPLPDPGAEGGSPPRAVATNLACRL